ncbi:MAG: DUF6090 family protein, partial [Bacteroidota bacterium]
IIRQKLPPERNLKKFFFYAAGDFFLFLFGIFFSFLINICIKKNNDRKKEALILKQIHRDFKSNKKQLDSIVIINQKKLNALTVFIDELLVNPDSSAIDTLLKYAADIYTIKTFNPSNGAVEALINSSSFELIQNDSLRNLLVSWQDVYEDYSEEEQLERSFQLQNFTPYLRKHFNFLKPYAKPNLEVIKTVEFQNTFLDKRLLAGFVLEAIEEERIKYDIDEIIRLSHYDD